MGELSLSDMDNCVFSSGRRHTFFFFQAEDGIRDHCVTGVQTCALPICSRLLRVVAGVCGRASCLDLLIARYVLGADDDALVADYLFKAVVPADRKSVV